MCQGFSHFSVFLHHFILAKLATSSIRVRPSLEGWCRTLGRTLKQGVQNAQILYDLYFKEDYIAYASNNHNMYSLIVNKWNTQNTYSNAVAFTPFTPPVPRKWQTGDISLTKVRNIYQRSTTPLHIVSKYISIKKLFYEDPLFYEDIIDT